MTKVRIGLIIWPYTLLIYLCVFQLADAKKLCPNLVVVHVQTYKDGETQPAYHPNPNSETHKVSLDHYRRESIKIINILKENLVGAEVGKSISVLLPFVPRTTHIPLRTEKASIDEGSSTFPSMAHC